MGKIYITRKPGATGVAVKMICYINDEEICRIKENETYFIEKENGTYIFKCKLGMGNPVSDSYEINVTNENDVMISAKQNLLKPKVEILYDEGNVEKYTNGVKKAINLKKASDMYQYCLDNGLGSGWNRNWGEKHFGLIENSLMAGEEVLMTFIGLHNYISMTKHDSNFAYAVTNKRIIMAQKKIIGENFQTVSFENVNDITFTSGLAFGILTIDTFKEKFNIALDKISAKKISEQVHSVFDDIRNKSKIESSNTNSYNVVSSADEIKKFKELLDAGAITQEEFDAKKKQLLGV